MGIEIIKWSERRKIYWSKVLKLAKRVLFRKDSGRLDPCEARWLIPPARICQIVSKIPTPRIEVVKVECRQRLRIAFME